MIYIYIYILSVIFQSDFHGMAIELDVPKNGDCPVNSGAAP